MSEARALLIVAVFFIGTPFAAALLAVAKAFIVGAPK